MPDWMETVAGIRTVSREAEVWEILDRWPDKYDKKGGIKEEGRPRCHVRNVSTILEEDTRWRGRIRLDELSRTPTIGDASVTDETETEIAVWIGKVYSLDITTTTIGEAIRYVASHHPFHPVAEYLDSLTWDQKPRVRSWLTVYLGAATNALIETMGTKWMVSAVARAKQPGCKVDHCMIFVGKQYAGKSLAIKTLAVKERWFSDTRIDLDSKDRFENLRGAWIYEFGELASFKRSDSENLKSYLSSPSDKYRPSYGRNRIEVPRTNVFFGSTNEPEFLADPTGSRRFWPVTSGTIDIEALIRDRDQLWAEAVVLYRNRAVWHLDGTESGLLTEHNEQYQQQDPWTEPIRKWTRERVPFHISEVMAGALDIEPCDQSKAASMRAAGILTQMGCTKWREPKGERRWLWQRPPAPTSGPTSSNLVQPPLERLDAEVLY